MSGHGVHEAFHSVPLNLGHANNRDFTFARRQGALLAKAGDAWRARNEKIKKMVRIESSPWRNYVSAGVS
jgi:hypothetical protein